MTRCIVTVAAFFAPFAMMAFTMWNANPSGWGWDARLLVAVLSPFAGLGAYTCPVWSNRP